MSGAKKLQPNEILFREGDPSDAMYVLKSGKLTVFKQKGNGEIQLAEVNPGAMIGEMAFFDNKPRSASVKAMKESEVVILPFKALYAQFKTMPEWLKAMVKTVNDHLREANKRIKNLEQANTDTRVFPPHLMTKLTSILCFVAQRYGESTPEGLVLNGMRLRNYTIQVFQEPTNRMNKLLEQYSGMGYAKVEDLGEGRQKVTVKNLDLLFGFVEFYNEYLFKEESKRTTIEEKELVVIKALLHFAKGVAPDDKGLVKVSLTKMQNESMKEMGQVITVNAADPLAEKKLVQEKMSANGELFTSFKLEDLNKVYPFWQIVYALEKVQK